MQVVRLGATPGDVARAADVVRAAAPSTGFGEADIAAWLQSEPRGAMFVARRDRHDVAVAILTTITDSDQPDGLWMWLWCPDDAVAAAVSSLWRHVRAHLDQHGVQYVRCSTPQQALGDVLVGEGFVVVDRDQVVSLRLARRPLPPPARDDVQATTLAARPQLLDALVELDAQCVPQIPTLGAPLSAPGAQWWHHHLSAGSLKPETVVIATADDRPQAYSVLRHRHGRPDMAHHDMTGTHADARGRGLAVWVKQHLLCAAWDAGVRELRAWNSLDNAPMRAVNARLGYVREPDSVGLRFTRSPG